MTIKQIQQIVGAAADPYEWEMLAAADKQAAQFLRAGGGMFMTAGEYGTDAPFHYDALHAIAAMVIGADDLAKHEAEFEAVHHQANGLDVSGIAAAVYSPQISAAYYFGLAIGLRIAATGKAATR